MLHSSKHIRPGQQICRPTCLSSKPTSVRVRLHQHGEESLNLPFDWANTFSASSGINSFFVRKCLQTCAGFMVRLEVVSMCGE